MSRGTTVLHMDYSVLDIRIVGSRPDTLPATGRLVGDVLDRQTRLNDVVLRFHNGRFVVIMVNVGPQAAEVIAQRLQMAVEALAMTGLAVEPIEFELEIRNLVHPEDSVEPSVDAAVADAAVRLGVASS